MKRVIGYSHDEIDGMYPYEFDVEYWMTIKTIGNENR